MSNEIVPISVNLPTLPTPEDVERAGESYRKFFKVVTETLSDDDDFLFCIYYRDRAKEEENRRLKKPFKEEWSSIFTQSRKEMEKIKKEMEKKKIPHRVAAQLVKKSAIKARMLLNITEVSVEVKDNLEDISPQGGGLYVVRVRVEMQDGWGRRAIEEAIESDKVVLGGKKFGETLHAVRARALTSAKKRCVTALLPFSFSLTDKFIIEAEDEVGHSVTTEVTPPPKGEEVKEEVTEIIDAIEKEKVKEETTTPEEESEVPVEEEVDETYLEAAKLLANTENPTSLAAELKKKIAKEKMDEFRKELDELKQGLGKKVIRMKELSEEQRIEVIALLLKFQEQE